MNRKQINEQVKTIRTVTKEILKSPQKSRDFLEKAGIIKNAPAEKK